MSKLVPPSRRQLLALLSLGALTPRLAFAQEWPSKPLKWIVAYPAGGGSDFLARNIAPGLSKLLGQTIVIENRPGAGGTVGTDAAAKSPADGYTLLSGDNGVMVFASALYKKLNFSPSDFEPVCLMARFPLILAVHPQGPFTSGRQWLDKVKQNPGKFNYASPGVGSPHHLAMELLKHRSGSFIVHVPYRGTAPAMQDLLSGLVEMAVLDTAAGLPQIRAGKLKPLAVLAKKRLVQLPDVPTFAELGLVDVDVSAWQGLFVPRNTPAPVIERLASETQKVLQAPEIKARLEDFGLEVMGLGSQRLNAYLASEIKTWHRLIKERGLSAE